MSAEDVYESQILELRRGTIVLAILSQLHTPAYGYGLLQRLELGHILIDAGTLYPLLRRLEKQGILESMWQEGEARPRKYYQLSSEGEKLYAQLVQEWQQMNASLEEMIKEDS